MQNKIPIRDDIFVIVDCWETRILYCVSEASRIKYEVWHEYTYARVNYTSQYNKTVITFEVDKHTI
jgi:hypothetical protein